MKKKELFIGILIILLGLVISVGPYTFFHVCKGNMGMEGQMSPCQKTAVAELVVGILLAISGVISFVVKTELVKKISGIFHVVIGILVIAFATVITGTCKDLQMHCNTTTKPWLIVLGSLVIVLGLVESFFAFRKKQDDIYEKIEQEIQYEDEE
ncbi:MAG: DUF4418 family protein [Eubacterium sp.]|nr:DUF4418 family protein [Eubacterium sp.]